jgi:ABC-type transporter Mla subunit MlaD
MLKTGQDKWVALTVVACSIVVLLALAVAIGGMPLGTKNREITVRFAYIGGIGANSEVKYAGAKVGRVSKLRFRSREEVRQEPTPPLWIELKLEVDPSLVLGSDVKVELRQDTALAPNYVALVPVSFDTPPLADNAVLIGEPPVGLNDLFKPGKELVQKLQPAAESLSTILVNVREDLPPLLNKLDSMLSNGDQILGAVNTPEGREQLRRLLANLRVVSDNLKIVTTQAKGATRQLGERPWSLLWGGEPVVLPTEEEILKSNTPLPVKTQAEAAAQARRKAGPDSSTRGADKK